MPKGLRISWTDQEWNEIADKVWLGLSKDPTATLIQLATRAEAQFPKYRQRILRTNKDIEPLIHRIGARYRYASRQVDELLALQKALSIAQSEKESAAALLESLSDQEILDAYGERVLELLGPSQVLGHYSPRQVMDTLSTGQLAGEAVQRILDLTPAQRTAPVPASQKLTPAPVRQRRKRVAIIGLLSGQANGIQKLVPDVDIIAVPKGQNIPSKADFYIAWTKFISHSDCARIKAMAGERFAYHDKGLNLMADLIKESVK